MNNHLFSKIERFARKDKTFTRRLKELLVNRGNYELATEVKAFEDYHFALSEEDKALSNDAEVKSRCLEMLDINSTPKTTFIAVQALKIFEENEGNFGTKDVAKINEDANRIFG